MCKGQSPVNLGRTAALWLVLATAWSVSWFGESARGQMQVTNGCMQDVAGFSLNCTANDVRVASVTNIVILDDGCAFLGDTVTFSADYEILLTAQERHDIGVYLALDGGTALTGTCEILTLPEVTDLDSECKNGKCSEDGVTVCSPNENPSSDCVHIDLCGDIDASPNPIILTGIVVTAMCVDPDGDNRLDLPNCTSWRQPGSNEICTHPTHAYPGSPSKCRCDPGFDVEIFVPNDPCMVSWCQNDNSILCSSNADCAAVGGTCIKTLTPVDCSSEETACATFTCDPEGAEGNCDVMHPKALSTVCEADANLCTPDHCDGAGSCVPNPGMQPVDCSGVDLNQCTDTTCDPATGMCTVPAPKPLSTPCEADASLCTPDHCNGAGSCVPNPGLPPVDCSGVDLNQCTGTSCDPSTGMCTVPEPKPLSTVCEADGNLCTPDHCNGAGSCVRNLALPVVDCTGVMLNQCTDTTCDPGTGLCTVPDPRPLSTVCEADASLCTADHCDGAGNCVPNPAIPPVDCTGIDLNQCTDTTCDPATGMCTVPAYRPLSTVCEADSSLCTPDHCDGAGNCVPNPGSPPVDCTGVTLNQCTDTSCDPATGMCTVPVYKPFSTVCERNDPLKLCTADHCDGAGNCVENPAIPPPVCNPSVGDCEAGERCNPDTGLCEMLPDAPFSTPCEADNNLCTPDHCNGTGSCVPNPGIPPVDCTGVMLNECTDTACHPGTGQCTVPVYKPLSTVCEADASLCTPDHCDGAGNCVPNPGIPPVDCTGVVLDQCNDATCDPATGMCTVPDPKPLSTVCEADGNLCTPDHCNGAGSCVFNPGAPPVDCSGVMLDQCNGATCNPSTGLCTVPDPKPLSTVCEADGTLCTPDHCNGTGSCVPNPAIPPVDCTGVMLNQCTDSACNPATGLCTVPVYKPFSTVCEADASLCTPDHCNGSGACVPNPAIPPVDCSGVMLNQCTGTSCHPATGMCTVPVFLPLSAVCEAEVPANLCTPDHCNGAGNCVPNPGIPPVDCDCGMDCTECVPATGTCEPSDGCDGTGCPDDGYGCTLDRCVGGVCTHTPIDGVCDDSRFCTNDRCDPTDPNADPVTGCVNDPDDANCNDGVDCTNPDVCDPGNPLANADGCVLTPHDSKCDDEDRCTDDICDAAGAGECINPDNGLCGACCDGETGLCTDDLLQSECVGDQAEWTQGTLCANLSPACVRHRGACCERFELESFCTDGVLPEDCVGPNQTWSKGETCDEIDCDIPIIPTMSSWGLTVLALILLVGAKVYFGRRPEVGTV